jgi:hypothetical protein
VAPNVLSIVAKAQGTSILGVHGIEESELPYESLGEDKTPYDLNDPVAIQQVKSALLALGRYWSDRVAREDPAIETRWSWIDPSVPSWDPSTADEFAFAVGRLRGLGWQVSGPYAVETPVGPQPTATGLELIAGAVNDLLGGTPRMTHYEAWRGGWVSPPSVISGPAPSDPVSPCQFYGPAFNLPPYGLTGGLAGALELVRRALTQAWIDAMEPGQNEAYRKAVEQRILEMRGERDRIVEIAIAGEPIREGQTTVEHLAPEACANAGGIWNAVTYSCDPPAPKAPASPSGTNYAPWVLLALGAGGVAYALWKRNENLKGQAHGRSSR